MNTVFPDSVYVVHSRCVSLGRRPFLQSKLVRPAFQFIFNSRGCYTDFFAQQHQKLANPFIQRLGAIGLGPTAERMVNRASNGYLSQLHMLFSDQDDEEWSREDSRLGYIHGVPDQRMHFIFFELLHPLKLVAREYGQVMANAKLFIHIYPVGYIVSHLAVSLTDNSLRDPRLTSDILQNLRPWKQDLTWLWSSRLGDLPLNQTMDEVDSLLRRSLLTENIEANWDQRWRTSIKVKYPVIKHRYKYGGSRRLGTFASDWLGITENEKLESFEFRYRSSFEEILFTHQGNLFVTSLEAQRRSALRLFWSILFLQEIVLLKKQIYRDYIDNFQSDLLKLKEFRLSLKKRIQEQSLTEITVYEEDIARHLWAVDRVIRPFSPVSRALYSMLANSNGLDTTRNRASKLLNAWEDEIAQYEPLIFAIWKTIITPLRAIFIGE